MKSATLVAAAAGLALTAAASAQFSGPYAPANWSLNANGGNGGVDANGAPASIIVYGNGSSSPLGGTPISGVTNTDYTISAAAAGMLMFDWQHGNQDTGTYDNSYYLINGVPVFLATNNSPFLSGQVSVPVNGGDIIGFRMTSMDSATAVALTISNFSAPIPAPGAFALLGLGGVFAARRRR